MPLESEMSKELKVKIPKKVIFFYVIVACRLKLCTKRVQRYSTRGKEKKLLFIKKMLLQLSKEMKKGGN